MTQAVKLAQLGSPGISTGFKNRIINGAMVVNQRAYSATPSTSGTYTLDRWRSSFDQASKFSVQQSSTAPSGFTNSLLLTSTSAYTVGANEQFSMGQRIEGYNIADLAWGTADAAAVTLSFKVRSSLTGTFSGSLENDAQDRAYPFTYTISAANTWEQKSVTIPGETSGTWLTTNGVGINLSFCIGGSGTRLGTANTWANTDYKGATGTTNLVSTNGATLYITGVQLEVGTTATDFEYRDYGRELMMCQRYYQQLAGFTCVGGNATEVAASIPFTLPMRASPSVSQTGVLTIENIGTADITQSSVSISVRGGNRINSVGAELTINNFSGLTQFRPYVNNVNHNGTDNYITLSAEL